MSAQLNEEERGQVLALARRAVEDAAARRGVHVPVAEGVFATRAGAFVSLHRHGDLRGCIGHIDSDQTLAQVISRCAAAAATEDPRFEAVTAAEVTDLHIEVSVLAGIERVTNVEDIIVGRHGLIVEQQRHRGLLLPQVASERGWDRLTFLSQTCRKAGLSPDAWKSGATIYRFEAEVFGEPRE